MKIFCLTCKEAILTDSKEFVLGGPYDGSMFDPISVDNWTVTNFRNLNITKGGDLFCPRCQGRFLGNQKQLLTEHGVVEFGQRSIDKSLFIVHQEGEAKGMLMGSNIPSKELPNDAPPEPKALDYKVDGAMVFEDIGLDPAVKPIQIKPLICPKCGKKYKDLEWYDKHVEKCGGK